MSLTCKRRAKGVLAFEIQISSLRSSFVLLWGAVIFMTNPCCWAVEFRVYGVTVPFWLSLKLADVNL